MSNGSFDVRESGKFHDRRERTLGRRKAILRACLGELETCFREQQNALSFCSASAAKRGDN